MLVYIVWILKLGTSNIFILYLTYCRIWREDVKLSLRYSNLVSVYCIRTAAKVDVHELRASIVLKNLNKFVEFLRKSQLYFW